MASPRIHLKKSSSIASASMSWREVIIWSIHANLLRFLLNIIDINSIKACWASCCMGDILGHDVLPKQKVKQWILSKHFSSVPFIVVVWLYSATLSRKEQELSKCTFWKKKYMCSSIIWINIVQHCKHIGIQHSFTLNSALKWQYEVTLTWNRLRSFAALFIHQVILRL